MKLFVDSNVAYLILLRAKSRIAGYFYLSSTLIIINESILGKKNITLFTRVVCILSSSYIEKKLISKSAFFTKIGRNKSKKYYLI